MSSPRKIMDDLDLETLQEYAGDILPVLEGKEISEEQIMELPRKEITDRIMADDGDMFTEMYEEANGDQKDLLYPDGRDEDAEDLDDD